jgi:hypothetical protein
MSEEDDEALTVEATIAQVTGALKTMADGGFRWIFDIPQIELPAHVRMHLHLNKRLKLTIEALEDDGETPERSESDRRADRELSSIRLH